MKKIWKKTVSFIIVLSILFTSQGIDVLAKEKLNKRESVNLHGKLKYDKIYKNLTKNVKNINVDTCNFQVHALLLNQGVEKNCGLIATVAKMR